MVPLLVPNASWAKKKKKETCLPEFDSYIRVRQGFSGGQKAPNVMDLHVKKKEIMFKTDRV